VRVRVPVPALVRVRVPAAALVRVLALAAAVWASAQVLGLESAPVWVPAPASLWLEVRLW